MATSPQPPQPPVPPAPPRPNSNVVAIVLLILGLIVVVCGMSVWTGLHYLSKSVHIQEREAKNGKKEVSVKTPFGSMEVHPEANEANLGLPIYPGATAIKEDGGATINFDFANEQTLRVVAGKFETPDPFAKVKDFYRERLGDQVSKFTERSPDGKTVFEMKSGDMEKVVALKRDGDRTRIELVRISHGRQEAN